MDEFQERLKESGLTGNESKVYLELFRKGELSANEIAKKISMDRTLVYTLLNNLIEKGMISYVIKSNKKFFKSENPENLLNSLKEKEFLTKKLISQLKKIKQIKDSPYEIKIYEGKGGLKTFFRLMIKYKNLCIFGATGKAYDLLYELQSQSKKLKNKGYSARIITSKHYESHEMNSLKYIKFKYLDIKSNATTGIFGDYVSIHLLTQKPLVILIKNKEIAESYKSHFEILWKYAIR